MESKLATESLERGPKSMENTDRRSCICKILWKGEPKEFRNCLNVESGGERKIRIFKKKR